MKASLSVPKSVNIREHIASEGFQGEEHFIPTESKVFIVERLVDAGFKSIWVSTFSRPAVQPQFRDCEEVYGRIPRRDDVTYLAPTPNMRALERAIKCKETSAGPNTVDILIGSTEVYNKTMLGFSTEDYFKFCEQAIKVAHKAGLRVSTGIVGVWYCLMDGSRVPEKLPYEMADRLMAMGADEIGYIEGGDGPSTPSPIDVYEFFSRMLEKYPDPKRHYLHYHDKCGVGPAILLAAMQAGVTQFDTTIGGMSAYLGRIVDRVPTMLKGAIDPPLDFYTSLSTYGQVPTEDFAAMCQTMGVQTGIDMDKLVRLGLWVEKIVGRKLGSDYIKVKTEGLTFKI